MKKTLPGDIIVALFFILLAVISAYFLWPSKNVEANDSLIANIFIEGEKVTTIDLNSVGESYYILPKDGVSILVEKGRIRFSDSNCKDKICVKAGWLDSQGESAICAPEMCIINIEGGEIDAIAG